MSQAGKYLGIKWTPERRKMLTEALDYVVEELNEDPMFLDRLAVLIELAGVEEWPTVPGVMQLEPVYRLTRSQVIRMLYATSIAKKIPGAKDDSDGGDE